MPGALQWARQAAAAAPETPRRVVVTPAFTRVAVPAAAPEAAAPAGLGVLRGYNRQPLGDAAPLHEVIDAFVTAGSRLIDDDRYKREHNYGWVNRILDPMVEAGVPLPHITRTLKGPSGESEVRRFIHQDYGPGGLQSPQQAVETFARITPGYGARPEDYARAIEDLAPSMGVDPAADFAVKQAAVLKGVESATALANKVHGARTVAARHGAMGTGAALAAAAPEQRQQLLEAIGAQRLLEELGGAPAPVRPAPGALYLEGMPGGAAGGAPAPVRPAPGALYLEAMPAAASGSAPPAGPPPPGGTTPPAFDAGEPSQPGWWQRRPIDAPLLRNVPNWAYVSGAGVGGAALLAGLLASRGQPQDDYDAYSQLQAASNAYGRN